jgi:hypothetical protein
MEAVDCIDDPEESTKDEHCGDSDDCVEGESDGSVEYPQHCKHQAAKKERGSRLFFDYQDCRSAILTLCARISAETSHHWNAGGGGILDHGRVAARSP